jgi:hypothetical protein
VAPLEPEKDQYGLKSSRRASDIHSTTQCCMAFRRIILDQADERAIVSQHPLTRAIIGSLAPPGNRLN